MEVRPRLAAALWSVGEAKIARDTADLMGKALKRLKELEESE